MLSYRPAVFSETTRTQAIRTERRLCRPQRIYPASWRCHLKLIGGSKPQGNRPAFLPDGGRRQPTLCAYFVDDRPARRIVAHQCYRIHPTV
jgi:hypothetical protein